MARCFIQIGGLILSVNLLVSCSTHRPASAEFANQQRSEVQIIAIPEGQEAKRTLFSKLVLNIPRGSTYGAVTGGAFCAGSQRELKWQEGPLVLREEDVRTAFNDVLQKASYPIVGDIDSLFDDFSSAELIVAGLIKDLRVDICNKVTMGILVPTQIDPRTDLSLIVNWQVFSRIDGKVVYDTITRGEYTGPGNLRACIISAFANATAKLLAERAFYEVVVGRKKGLPPA